MFVKMFVKVRMKTMTDSELCLQALNERDGLDGHYVTSCVVISRMTGLPIRKVRETMQKLEAAGCAIQNQEGGCDGWTNERYCIHGYSITKEGRKRCGTKEETT